jgi:PAS domain S-box-containing protein
MQEICRKGRESQRPELPSPRDSAPADIPDAAPLAAENQQLRAILASLPGAAYRLVCRSDGSLALPYVGDSIRLIAGLAPAELQQDPDLLFTLFSPEDRSRIAAVMRGPIARMMPIDAELLIRPRGAAERWVRFVARPSKLSECEVAWDGIVVDVDDDVRRRLSHALLATIIEHAGDSIEITDADFRLQYVNPAFERNTGYSRAEAVGRTPGSFLRSGEIDLADYQAIERTIRAGQVWRGELTARRRDDELRYQEATISPVVDADGSINHFVAIKRDVTARRRAEAALEDARGLLTDTIESISEAIALFDADDRLVLHNRRFLEVHPFLSSDGPLDGLRFEEILRQGLAVGAFRDPAATRDPENWLAARLDRHRNPTDEALEQPLADGRWVRVTERRTKGGGIVGVWTDITELKWREVAVLQAKEAAEAANRAKSTFLANMSHELRTPLNAVIGFAELITLQLNGPIGSERYLDYARDIRLSGEHLLGVINDILDLSRIEAGAVDLDEDDIVCADLLDSCAQLVRGQATRAGLALEVEAPRDLPEIRGDRRRLRQVLINLLSNAVKFTPAGGRIRMGAAREPGGGLVLCVEDTGIGMSAEGIAEALTPFKQLDTSLARRYEGAGLGLPLAKNLLELHGGRLELESEIGRGTTARCWLPPARLSPAG